MAFNLDIEAGSFSLSIQASPNHLSVLGGRSERGFVLESSYGKNENGKLVEIWRNDHCGSFNVSAFGFHLIACGGRKRARNLTTA